MKIDIKIELSNEEIIDFIKNDRGLSVFYEGVDLNKILTNREQDEFLQRDYSGIKVLIQSRINHNLKDILLNPSAHKRDVKIDNILS